MANDLKCNALGNGADAMAPISILPSLLASDIGNLEHAVRRAEEAGADGIHVDIMDGHFVPNLSMGPDVVKMARRCSRLPLSVHLMMSRPDQFNFIERFIEAGSNPLLIHIEASCDVPRQLDKIRSLGVSTGITLNPGTPPEAVFPVLDLVDEVLCMSVNPGYGGQKFMDNVIPKIRCLRDEALRRKKVLRISVDGGIDRHTAPIVCAAGADTLIAGTSLYGAPDMAAAITAMRDACTAHVGRHNSH